MVRVGVVVASGLIICSSELFARTLRVPLEYPDITSAANVAQRGDSILVWKEPNGWDWENQQINLVQGVVLRGMEQLYPATQMWIRNSTVNLLESPPSPNDTTRVEHFAISNPFLSETVQVFTPRSSVVDCFFWTFGPQDYTTVRVHRGGLVARNYFSGTGECNGMEARQGTIRVENNAFVDLFTSFALHNDTAPGTVALQFKNNDVRGSGDMYLFIRPDSYVEFVNNIVVFAAHMSCSGPINVRYNDFYLTTVSCPLGIGNISADPLFCENPDDPIPWIDADSPCVGTGENGATMGAGGICGITGLENGQDNPTHLWLRVDPNPIIGSAEFSMGGANRGSVLEIFNPQGQLIDMLHPLGTRIPWVPEASLPRGIYFARLRGNKFSQTVKFLIIR
jgi:hypothetical protein